ncbi:MAG TPA: (Fe-S)-binding protein [Dissulfurispiraceae bacterium]|nr:(Fe-S)-binding protein [Dissulfurispiraceae bacterium]
MSDNAAGLPPEVENNDERDLFGLESCVRCGSCKARCPTYEEDPHEGMSARGRAVLLDSFLRGEIGVSDKLDGRIQSCMLCGSCSRICPLGISVPGAVYHARSMLRSRTRKRRMLNLGARLAVKKAREGFVVAKWLKAAGAFLPLERFEPYQLMKDLDLQFPDRVLREGTSIFKVSRSRGRIAVFAGCTVNYLFPSLGADLIRSLNALRFDVIMPRGEACCAAPLLSLGLVEDAAAMAEKNVRLYRGLNTEAVISLCPTCTHFIGHEYGRLIGEGIDNTREVSQFFADRMKEGDFDGKAPLTPHRQGKKIIYHDPCHAVNYFGARAEPRDILSSMGISLTEPKDRGCCGFAGTFRVLHGDLSKAILERRIGDYADADTIVTSCPNCMIQFRSRMKDKEIKHIIEYIRYALPGGRHG